MAGERPRRGVSLYSYQQEYYLEQLSLEDCIRVSAELGAMGIETIAEQMMPGFPELSDAFYERWHEWMARYGTTPTAHDMFLDMMLYKDRRLTEEEMLESIRRDIRHAARLGCSVIRMIVITPPELIAKCIPDAADAGVKLALEVHSPQHFEADWILKHYEVYQQFGPEHVGFMPDMGIFVRRFPRVISERALRDGATPDHVRRIVDAYDSAAAGSFARDIDLSHLPGEIEERGGNEQDINLARMAGHFVSSDPSAMREFMPYIHHVHGKFYEMTEALTEYSIPYEEVVPILIDGGFAGWISSEYEGQRHIQDAFEVDSVEQVRRHQQLLENLLVQSETEGSNV